MISSCGVAMRVTQPVRLSVPAVGQKMQEKHVEYVESRLRDEIQQPEIMKRFVKSQARVST